MTAHSLNTPQFYLTAPAPCPYLPGQMERKVFTHLIGERAKQAHDDLAQGGFRRSQNIAYRPACEGCRACVATRVLVDEFKPSRNMRRVIKRNGDLIGTSLGAVPTSEQYSLFRRYIETRHEEGGMAAMTVLDYAMMVEDSHVDTEIIEYRRRSADSAFTGKGEGPLLAVVLSDRLANGLSMVYSFFDPAETDRSLGTFVILDHIERTRKEGLPHCHLGYWVHNSPKMAYKARFLPQERLYGGGWVRIENNLHAQRGA
ncbi:MAG: arginyltransferase [Pseudomonadota bacterium]